MILFSFAIVDGFNRIKIEAGSQKDFKLDGSTLIYSLGKPLPTCFKILSGTKQSNKSLETNTTNTLHLITSRSRTAFINNTCTEPQDFEFWVLPQNQCEGVSLGIITEFEQKLTVHFTQESKPTCIFFPTDVTLTSTKIRITEGKESSSVDIFGMTGEESSKIKNHGEAYYKSTKPYYLKVQGFPLDIDMEVKAKSNGFKEYQCEAKVADISIDLSAIDSPVRNDVEFLQTKCKTLKQHKNDVYTIAFYGSALVLTLIVFIFVTIKFRICDCFLPSLEDEKFADLKGKPYVRPLDKEGDNISIEEISEEDEV